MEISKPSNCCIAIVRSRRSLHLLTQQDNKTTYSHASMARMEKKQKTGNMELPHLCIECITDKHIKEIDGEAFIPDSADRMAHTAIKSLTEFQLSGIIHLMTCLDQRKVQEHVDTLNEIIKKYMTQCTHT